MIPNTNYLLHTEFDSELGWNPSSGTLSKILNLSESGNSLSSPWNFNDLELITSTRYENVKIAGSLHLLSPKSLKLDLSEQGWTAVTESVLPMCMQPHSDGQARTACDNTGCGTWTRTQTLHSLRASFYWSWIDGLTFVFLLIIVWSKRV